jgi:hypothetical protein
MVSPELITPKLVEAPIHRGEANAKRKRPLAMR